MRHLHRDFVRVVCRAILLATLITLPAAAQMVARWQTNATPWKRQIGKTFSVWCAPSDAPGAPVWGSEVYTDDSSICRAAEHALVSFDHVRGGTVYFRMEPGQASYDSSSARGVAT